LREFQFLESFPLAWVVLILTVGLTGFVYSQRRRKQLSEVFEQGGYLNTLALSQQRRLGCSKLLYSLGALLACMALMRPVWNPVQVGVAQNGRDLIFVLDVSRSMLAKDSRPNRLEVAKAAIEQCLNSKRGDRYALMAFAGSASIRCPLTRDQRFFRKMLLEMGPDSVAQGGTRIEDALTKVVDKLLLDEGEDAARDVILISDGEDLGSKPERAINKLNALGVRLLVIGLGDSEYGERIPNSDGNGYVTYKGKEVWTRHQPEALRELTKLSNQGVYFPIGTGALNLQAILAQLSHTWPGKNREEAQQTRYTEGYPYLIALTCLCWLFALVLESNWSWQKQVPVFASVVLGLGLLNVESLQASESNSSQPTAESPLEELAPLKEVSIRKAMATLLTQDWAMAERLYGALAERENEPVHEYHLGYAQLKNKKYDQAVRSFENAALKSERKDFIIQARFNAASALLQWAFELEELWKNPELDEEELEEMMTPQEVFQRAIRVYRDILWEQPQYTRAAWNLEWCMRYLYRDEDSQHNKNQQQQQQQGEKQKAEEQSKSDKEKSDDEKDGEGEGEGQPSDQNPAGDRMLKMSSLSLPPPAASPEEILAQEQQNQLKRDQSKSGERAKVEKDW